MTHGYCVRSTEWRVQAREVIDRFDLRKSTAPFTRCIVCNGMLEAVDKKDIVDKIDEKAKQYYDRFSQCGKCGKVYWKGSHYRKLERIAKALSVE